MNKNHRLSKRILSFVLAVNLIIVNICFDELIPNIDLFHSALTAEAYSPTILDEHDPTFNAAADGFVYLSLGPLKDYAYYYSTSSDFADLHEDDKIKLSFLSSEDTLDSDYIPLGTVAHPFNGSLLFTTLNSVYTLKTHVPVFDYITDDAIIGDTVTLNLYNHATDHALLANHVKHGTGSAEWNLYLDDSSVVTYSSSVSYSGVIGEMMAEAKVKLSFTDNSSAPVSNSSGDAGMICDTMRAGSKITLSLTKSTAFDVTSTSGNAGALVGSMYSGSSVELEKIPAATSSSAVKAASNGCYAGGLAGWVENASIGVKSGGMTVGTTSGVTAIPVSGSITATTGGAGGLFGHFTTASSSFDLKDYNITAAVYAGNCGGVFGVLENNKGASETAVSLTIKNTGNAGTVNAGSGSDTTYQTTGYFGGLVGKYSTDDLKNSLILDDLTISSTSYASFASYGGAIGYVAGAAYIKADDMQITASGTAQRDAKDYFGGLIGKTTEEKGVFVDLGSFELSADSSGFKGGGIVGNFAKGVLRLSGVTNMSSAKSQKGGQLVGVNDNVLVYAIGDGTNGVKSIRDSGTNVVDTDATGWSFKRSSSASSVDDLGTWGEVVRIADIEDSTNGVLTFDSTNHTVTIKAAETSMGTPTDLVKTALNIQLNNKSGGYESLLFTSGDANTRSTLLGGTLTLTANIDLSGTGIMGFMRDGSDSVGVFTGTLNGGSKKVTLAIGEKYGLTSSGTTISASNTGEGLGQIYAHPYNGLFAVIGNGTTAGSVSSVEIAGTVNVRNTIDGMNIGGIAAVSQGSTSLSGITASQTVNYGEPSSVTGTETAGKNIGGLIGLVNGSDNGTIAITGTNTISTTFNISNNFKSWNALGAFIGKVTSPKFTINIAQGSSDSLTVSHSMVDKNYTAGGNTDGGGLIGYITSGTTYSNRKINIKNLEFDGCTIVNKASTNGGGFLGYAWLDTETTIEGLKVKSGTITNSSSNVGVMCYEATGRWIVNDLEITNMSLRGGAGDSLGMLVNKAYSGTKGLCLDVLKAGYTLTDKSGSTGITLPGTLSVYDELAAYSAEDVIKGTNAGVISINMNSTRAGTNAKIRDYDTSGSTPVENGTGTYQNQLKDASSSLGSTTYANRNSRYYYNLDVMDKDASDKAQDIMLWSVKKYAASNISGLFVSSDSPFSFGTATTVKLSDYSYYPVYNVSSVTLEKINLEFGYSGIYALEGNSNNTDSYNRDPGAQNQHYLMQSGLFINGAEGSTATLNTVNISGDFLENGNYHGVLFSGTTHGNISVNGLVLDGITPKYNNNGTISNYNTGYLLVNKVKREDAFKANIQINLKNISNSDKYTDDGSTATVAMSLFGDVYGPTIGINVEDIKLDARSANGGLAALDTAYGTKNSIFTTATLFNSIMTSQEASMIYNYSWDKDWGTGNRNVTYGKEVKDSVEYAGKENKYYDSNNYTDPTSNSNTSEPYNFSSWRPYVAQAYTANQTRDANGCYYRELKVNVPTVAYAGGCGTYNDPYIIDKGDKLEAIAKLINSTGPSNANAKALPSLQLPKTLYDGIAANTTGARWCDDKADHAVYTYNERTGYYEWTKEDETVVQWSVDNVRLYLANAYYSLSASSDDSNGNIVLDVNEYEGLGGTEDASGKYAFRGVIIGNNRTIINNSTSPFIKVTNGCVVKNLNIIQNANVNVTAQNNTGSANAAFGYKSACQYYGGMIGEIMGGDNIIDNSYVEFGTTTVTLTDNNTNKYGTIVPVGGYVGVIVYGGLIFKNIDASKTDLAATGLKVYYKTNTSNNLAADTADAKAAIYVNPLVGRVINGYAVNETGGNAKDADGESIKQFSTSEDGHYHDDENRTRSGAVINTLKNGKKHYTITDLNPELAKLNVTDVATASADGNIDVPNAQAMFVLSLITQSTAGTATDSALGLYNNSLAYGSSDTAVYGISHNADYSSVGTNTALVYDDPDTEDVDESNLRDYQKLAYFDTANNADGNAAIPYIVKYYTVGSTTVGTQEIAVPHTETVTETVLDEGYDYTKAQFTGEAISSGSIFVIKGTRSDTSEYMTNVQFTDDENEGYVNNRNSVMKSTVSTTGAGECDDVAENKLKSATEFFFEVNPLNSNEYCIYYKYKDNNNVERNKYLAITDIEKYNNNNKPSKSENRGNLELSDSPCYFELEQVDTTKHYWAIKWYSTNDGKYKYINYDKSAPYYFGAYMRGDGGDSATTVDLGNKLALYTKTVTQKSHVESHIETTYTYRYEYTTTHNYPARCVTNTEGYYNITLTGNGTYQLPDSFRGLGCVGMYDSAAGKANNYSIKLNVFDGNGKTIDEDIFLNKFNKDNYFDKLHKNTDQDLSATANQPAINGNTNTNNHGIGLFDSVIMKGSGSKFSDFELTGSVRTAIYNYDYDKKGECHDISPDNLFLSAGGVCGWITNQALDVGFEGIDLNDLTICGTNHFGGLLGYSGLKSPADKKDKSSYHIWIKECTADNISIKATAGTIVENIRQARCGMGAFVGKVQEGSVYIYGSEYEDNENPDPDNNYSEVKIKSYELAKNSSGEELNYNMSAGGLVGFAGNGCRIYDMRVSPKSSAITVGGNLVNFAGGMVGGMQSSFDGGKTGIAVFKNCIVRNINVNGNYAGGIYGGKWDSNWTTYSITMDNCQMIGTPDTHNTIYGNDSFGDNNNTTANHVAYAGGLIGKLYPFTNLDDNNQVTYNVLIKDCVVKDYDITSANTATSYAGGFIGYASSVNNSVTCYMHDSSVENCKIGASGNYAGGVVGRIIQKDNNEILGYNIKLDTITTDAGDKMGAWIGYAPSDTDSQKTSIQLVGMAIYGTGFTKNIGNGATIETASFVFADYDGASKGTTENNITSYPTEVSTLNKTGNVEMPKYPYVNINPQSAMGTGEIISGDGAVLRSAATETAEYSGKTAEKTMALKLYEDSMGSGSRRYSTFLDTEIIDDNGIDYYMKQTKANEGDRISTWETETDSVLTGVDDFAMIVIANEGAEETSKLITRYIQLVTNTATNYSKISDYYTVVPTACVYNSTTHNFETTNATASISYTPGPTDDTYAFNVVRSGADSLSTNKFTLLDVQFKDPLNTNKIAYHLYVPVYVKRSISAVFSSTALSGTEALAENYAAGLSKEDILIENLDNWITAYIRYQYSVDDVNAILDSGNLDWNGSKQVELGFANTVTGTDLPDDTQLVLIDPNGNKDTAYYAKGSELSKTFSLSDFHKNYVGGTPFSEQHFCDILDGIVTVNDLNGTGDQGTGYYNSGTSDSYDIKIGDDYYVYVPEKTGRYRLTASRVLNEDYYISMLVPSDENGYVYKFGIYAPSALSGIMTTYVSKTNCVDVLLGDLFTQTITNFAVQSNEGDNDVIDDGNKTIHIEVTSTVKLKDADPAKREFYADYLNLAGTKLYHADVVSFTRHDVTGADNTIYGTDESNITTSGTVGGTTVDTTHSLSSSYVTVKTGDIRSQVIAGANTDNYNGVSISQTIAVTFPNYGEEFPARPADQTTNYGVNASVSSNISYDNGDLTYSGKKVSRSGEKRYYVENANSATLRYEANDELDIYDSVGSASYNYSHLGNNGIDRYLTCMWPDEIEGMPVTATAKYNAASVTNYDDAYTIRYALTLFKKTDIKDEGTGAVTGVEYRQVKINDYLKDVKLYGGSTETPLTKNDSSDDQKYVYSEEVSAANVDERVFTVSSYFEVLTGSSFHEYSNYKVMLEVRLLTQSGATISNSTQKDHIVYTNAKIYTEVIQD